LENFVISQEIMPTTLIHAIAAVKIAAAKANLGLKKIDNKRAKAIIEAGYTILKDKLNDQFPLKI
jgi:fumarate hydratase class II